MGASADEIQKQLKAERAAFRRQGAHGIKSKIKFRQCQNPSCGATFTHDGFYCANCLRNDKYARRMQWLQKNTCPTCRNPEIITGGVTCRECTKKIAFARKKDLQKHGTLEEVKAFLERSEGRQQAAPSGFDTRPYQIERRMAKLPKMTQPTLRVRPSRPFRGRNLNPPMPKARQV